MSERRRAGERSWVEHVETSVSVHTATRLALPVRCEAREGSGYARSKSSSSPSSCLARCDFLRVRPDDLLAGVLAGIARGHSGGCRELGECEGRGREREAGSARRPPLAIRWLGCSRCAMHCYTRWNRLYPVQLPPHAVTRSSRSLARLGSTFAQHRPHTAHTGSEGVGLLWRDL